MDLVLFKNWLHGMETFDTAQPVQLLRLPIQLQQEQMHINGKGPAA